MNRQVLGRIERLERLAALAEAQRAQYAPYSEVRIHSIARDAASVVYHPRGNYGASEKVDGLTISGAFDCAAKRGVAAFVQMIFSPEWFHSVIQAGDLYAPEQKDRFKEEDCAKWPEEIGWIYAQEDPARLINALSKIPQSFSLKGEKNGSKERRS